MSQLPTAKEEIRRPAIDDVRSELLRQDEQWGEVREEPAGTWALVLSEEVGELADDLVEETDEASAYREPIQVAAVGVAIATDLRMGFARDAQDPGEPPTAGTWALWLAVNFGALAKSLLEEADEAEIMEEASRAQRAVQAMLVDLTIGDARHTPKANA